MTPQHDSKRFLRAAILRGALVACLAQSGLAGRAFLCADVPQDLFDGTSLAGWSLVHDAQFSFKDGKLCLDGGNGWLRTNQRFRDFALTFEWRALGRSFHFFEPRSNSQHHAGHLRTHFGWPWAI